MSDAPQAPTRSDARRAAPWLAWLLASLAAVGCGQTGPLVLEAPPGADEPASDSEDPDVTDSEDER